MIDLNELSKKTLDISKRRMANGAYLSKGDFLKHCAGEVAEAMEARAIWEHGYYESDNLRNEFKNDFAKELADIIICVLDEAAYQDIDIEKAINEVVEKNEKRANKVGDKL